MKRNELKARAVVQGFGKNINPSELVQSSQPNEMMSVDNEIWNSLLLCRTGRAGPNAPSFVRSEYPRQRSRMQFRVSVRGLLEQNSSRTYPGISSLRS